MAHTVRDVTEALDCNILHTMLQHTILQYTNKPHYGAYDSIPSIFRIPCHIEYVTDYTLHIPSNTSHITYRISHLPYIEEDT